MAYNYIESTGVIVSDTSDLLEEVEGEYKTAFNDQSLITTPDTPQGALISTEVIARESLQGNNVSLSNQINPDIASGIFLRAIGRLTNLDPIPATRTVVPGVTIAGLSGTLIPALSQARSGDNLFRTVNEITIPASGTITTNFESVELGEIPCLANSLTQIETDVLGWETVNNTNAGVLGRPIQTDLAFRKLRRETLAQQGVAIPFAIRSNMRLVDGVRSLSFLENLTDQTEVIQGISLLPHSIYLCIDGGSDTDIANSLYASKTLGANYNGDTSVTINPTDSDAPYTAKFDRPDLIDIYIKITAKVTGSGEDPVTSIKNAVLAYANGQTAEDGFTVGNDVSSFEISASAAAQTNYFITSVTTSKQSDMNFSSDIISIGLDEKAQTFNSFITVTIA